MRYARELRFGLALLSLPLSAAAAGRPAPKKIALADGIYLFTTPSYGDVGMDGNSVVILSPDGVLVFDTNGTPAAAAAVLAEIRSMTDRGCAMSSTRTGTGTTGTAPRSIGRPSPPSRSSPTRRRGG